VVELRLKKEPDLSKVCISKSILWRHADEDVKRNEAVDELIRMLKELIRAATKEKLGLAPFIGIGCPGENMEDGTIAQGAQNLPGNWEAPQFDLPQLLIKSDAGDRWPRNRGRHAQRCHRSGLERSSFYAGRDALGSADDRDWPRQCAVH
jgi:hypothetical protein